MKNIIITFVLSLITLFVPAQANAQSASMTFKNRSDYTLTIKVMHTGGGLYSTITVGPNSSREIYFGSSGNFYCKTKAEKWSDTVYQKSSSFAVQNDSHGYSCGSMEFYVTSSSYGGGGSNISKAEFEKNS